MIETVVLSALRKGSREPYELHPSHASRVAQALAKALGGAEAVKELRRMLELVAALRTKLESPSAAATLETIVRSNALAVRLVALHILRTGAVDETRRFHANEGRRVPLRATRIDAPPPSNTIRLAEFLDPKSCGRVRRVKTI